MCVIPEANARREWMEDGALHGSRDALRRRAKSHGQTPLLSLGVQLDNFELSWISNLISHVGIARPNAVQHGHQVEEP